MENGNINKDSIRKLIQEALDRLNSDDLKNEIKFGSLAHKEIESARILLEVVIRDYLR